MDQDLPVSTRGLVAAKPRKRPQSRASTTSVRSAATQPNMDHGSSVGVSNMYAGQWINGDHGHAKNISVPPHLSTEDLILQAASHMQSASADFHMSAPMSAHTHMEYQRQPTMPRHPLPADQYAHGNTSFAESDSQMLDRDDNEDGESMVGNAGPPRPAASRSSANNELEMRQLFSANRHRRLQDVASELHGNERGPNSERTRQVFAMLWINSACTKGKCSVPRGRVYAHYASRCATERITVLNPASFGKLVRVLFPGLKTRRLGVRGESKYHYVNFAIVDDQPEARDSQPPVSRPLSEGHGLVHPINNTSSTQSARIASHDPPPSALSVSPNQQTNVRKARSAGMTHSLYNMPDLASIGHAHTMSAKTQLELAFPSTAGPDIQQLEPLVLPPIEAYLPQGTDVDAAKSLSALYRSHCTSLVECIRYCREKTYFHLYTSFQGTLTMPVQKLFGHAALAAWIEGCDYALYQRMMSIIAGLTLQVVPKPVLDTLRSISERLVPHIRESFQGQPQHVLAAKEAPAAVFAGLLDRALRVNLTAHAAANMLSNPANRDQMYVDWITMIRARKIAECVPTRSMDDLVDLLVAEMRDLLDPVNVPWEVECLTIYGDAASRSCRQASSNSDGDASGHNVLDRWVSFLQDLPEKFPYASHTEIVWCVERVGTAVMRDLTLAQGKSFGSWWVTKTWVDEMIRFLAEQGGFMKQKTRQPNRSVSPNTEERIQKTTNRHKSRCSSQRSSSASSTGSDELNTTNITKAQPERAPFPAPLAAAQGSTQAGTGVGGGDPHDDSGIGIRTPEEEFAMNKFGFTTADNMNIVVGTGLTTA